MSLRPKSHTSARALLVLSTVACCCDGCPADKTASTTARPVVARPALKATAGFVAVRAGAFTMGSPAQELARYTNEQQHKVTLSHDFELATTEVTQSQFQALMGYNPSHFGDCPRCPVETVSWHEAAAYCNALSRKRGLAGCYRCTGADRSVQCSEALAHSGGRIYGCPGYRLPTDAEWEYAYRAGTSTPYYSGTNEPGLRTSCSQPDPVTGEIGWYCQNSGGRTHEVGLKQKNAWGLADLGGNVWEWCHDQYLAVLTRDETDPWGIADSPMRVVRGGSWKYYSRGMRAACRAWYKPYYRGSQHGFRPARSL